jgi:4-amino-4-deoxy-L-arabinose transferase-like glycosyltransferase
VTAADLKSYLSSPARLTPALFAILQAALGGLALSRLLYELFFPRLLWLGRSLPALGLAVVAAVLGWLLASWLQRQGKRPAETILPFLPLVLNLIWLLDPAVNLIRSRFLFCASLWLMVVLLVHLLARPATWRWWGPLLVGFLLPVYLLTMGQTVGRADTFELQVVVPKLGIVHPTGYPLYLLLTKLFTFIPLNSMAWRVNLASAVYGLAALCLVYGIGWRLTGRPVVALLAAVALGLTPTFWSQTIEAEVYTLHLLVVAAVLAVALWVVGRLGIGDWRLGEGVSKKPDWLVVMAFLIGLGLANHVTAVFLLPGLALVVMFAWGKAARFGNRGYVEKKSPITLTTLLVLSAALLLPLLLYLYLPVRWAAVNGEPMGLGRFVEWVVGGRFQGALQWTAWLREPVRYGIVGRLLLAEWGWLNLVVIGVGFVFLVRRQPRFGLILLVTWLGYVFYALNYHVPDLAVFLLPAHLVMAVCWAVVLGVGTPPPQPSPSEGESGEEVVSSEANRPAFEDAGLLVGIAARPASEDARLLGGVMVALLLIAPALGRAAGETWPAVDRSRAGELAEWGRAVLAMPLAEGAAILADSEKIAPLYYWQQAEGVRPDLEILVLPDEASYRSELDRRIAAGQTVYLARFLPGLEGVYHLRSVGPLTEVSAAPLAELPAGVRPAGLTVGPIELLAYEIEPVAAIDGAQTAVTFYWQAQEAVGEVWLVYLRWAGERAVSQHPANNYYPTVAWEAGEIVPDYHLLPRPILSETAALELQVALAPPFSRPENLDWQTVTTVTVPASEAEWVEITRPLRAQIGGMLVDGATFPLEVRPGSTLPVVLSGYGEATNLEVTLEESGQIPNPKSQIPTSNPQSLISPTVALFEVGTDVANGRYTLLLSAPDGKAICGWLARPSAGCVLGEVVVSGVALPEGATNFADQIALLAVEVPERTLRPGGQLAVNLRWQALAAISENYTVFVQVLDEQDRLVGQVDSWPVQGTYPTSQWRVGEVVEDEYRVQLAADLPPGAYRLQVGWYLLATLQRLPVVDEAGTAVDDKLVVPGLVPE